MVSRADISILIAGAGPVGLTLALELARRGIKPRIVTQTDGPVSESESRALGVNARTLELLEPSGVAGQIREQAIAIEGLRLTSRGTPLLTIHTNKFRGQAPALSILPQSATERLLLEQLRTFEVEPEWHTTVNTVEGGAETPEVTLIRKDDSGETVKPTILVGADGAHSIVRNACGFTFPGEALENDFFLADYAYDVPVDVSYARVDFINPGVLGCIPVRANVLRYISTLPDFEDRIVHPHDPLEQTWRSDFKVSFRHVEAMSIGRVYLAGDAAHIHSPIGARGMNLGIEDACWLAWLISEGRETEYSALRLPAVRGVLRQTRMLTALATLERPAALMLRERLLPLMTYLPFAERRLVSGIAGMDTPHPPWIARTQ
ncbi:2-polyprenyl-6-methoxyphenol hydroxylase-like FAD-dependent oxidoreductase [Mycoplana sp. BE70]|uniref:FAD-dependent oxidoreductase n=1 Tax=Mycoplana sp. BE70 TaxID=2817775 RepID=UPI00285E3D12|nr:NAD(P)/FAD-dependent oxidoreductase [Mycoplana sp. BE70]MDR6756615.1 2-polyprenyl-6-methoxyphenol hydroxylase-like FAD-dependent oxidoreductase [Mycoplana sp. BE70]